MTQVLNNFMQSLHISITFHVIFTEENKRNSCLLLFIFLFSLCLTKSFYSITDGKKLTKLKKETITKSRNNGKNILIAINLEKVS